MEQKQSQRGSANRGILNLFDQQFTFAKSIGLEPHQLTNAHVPAAGAAIINLVYDMTLSPFGSVLASFLTGAGLAAVTATGKTSMVEGDKILSTEMSANMLWNNLRYANPKISGQVNAGATSAWTALMAGDINGLWAALTQAPAAAPVVMVQANPVSNVNNVPGPGAPEQNSLNNAVSARAAPSPPPGVGSLPVPAPVYNSVDTLSTSDQAAAMVAAPSKVTKRAMTMRFH